MKTFSRRAVLKGSLGTLGTLAASSALADTLARVCKRTPPQTEGPFYPIQDQLDKDTDLTRVKGRDGRAKGRVIYIRGQVRDLNCLPVSGALVEIWQACESGKYNHPGDDHDAPLDPDFQYWGRTTTDAEGRYLFKTIIPGAYPAADDWWRPPHVHFKVAKRGFRELTTQMYFKGEPLNDSDLILKEIPAAERDSVIVEFGKPGPEMEPDSQVGTFDLVLRKPL